MDIRIRTRDEIGNTVSRTLMSMSFPPIVSIETIVPINRFFLDVLPVRCTFYLLAIN